MSKIYVMDKVYIPASDVHDLEAVKQRYTHVFYEEGACAKCEYREQRHCSVCDACAAFKGRIVLHKTKEINGRTYIGLPKGDKKKIESVAGIVYSDYTIRDKRSEAPFKYPVKFIAKLYPEQDKFVRQFLRHKYGQIIAPPRFGKCLCLLAAAISLGHRIVILASQHEYLKQFIYHIEGNEDEQIPMCTNLPALEKKHKKKLYGFPKTAEDYKNFQIFVMTYQQFISKEGQKKLRRLHNYVGTCAIDEVDMVAANEFAKIIGSMRTKYLFGCTGTERRKDKKHLITRKVIGPITAQAFTESMTPKVFIHHTGVSVPRPPKLWTYAMQRLAKNPKRNTMIARQAVEDIINGHSVLIPVTFTKHMRELVSEINELYAEKTGRKKPIAMIYEGGTGVKAKDVRENTLRLAKEGKIKCIVGIRRLVYRGINVKPWSAIYTIIPINNEPNYKQETRRVCTKMEGKQQPIIRLFYDSMPQSLGCARHCVTHMKGFKYEFSEDKETQRALLEFESMGYRGKETGRQSMIGIFDL